MAGETNFQRMIKKMKLTLTALTVAATIFASSASAFDPDDLQKLKDTNECRICDLTNANLFGANLFGTNLSDANLFGGDLSDANLVGANLSDSNLESANLESANLSGAIMQGAILCNTTMPDGSVIYSGC